MKININNIFPLIVPASYLEGTWELPHYSLPNKSFVLTWVVFDLTNIMVYLTKAEYENLETNHKNWQQIAFENLRHSIQENENFFTYFKTNEDHQRLVYIAFMNGDGIGSSRILLSNELTKAFPNGYYLAFPDRSCGIVIAKDISNKELSETKTIVYSCFKDAITKMSNQVHNIKDFVLLEEWTVPIDEAFSQMLINEITKLRLQ